MRSRLFFCLMKNTTEFQEQERRLTQLLVKAIKNDQKAVFLGICSAGVDYIPKESMRKVLIDDVPDSLEESETKKMISWISQALQAMKETDKAANI